MKKILVTGAYGYIGSHTVKFLAEHGYEVTALDSKVTTNNVKKYASRVIISDLTDTDYHGAFDHVVHLAGAISVEESEHKPWKYIDKNINGTYNILDDIHYLKEVNFTFSSTAAAFDPVSVYAQTKLLAERLVRKKADKFTVFRFFNVAGNDGEFKQMGKATHLIRIAAEAAAGKRPYIQINGTDWDTPDGTCIRDYVHVLDVVHGIEKSIHYPSNKNYDCIASGNGYSVKEVIDTMKRVSGVDFQVVEGSRRGGDAQTILMPQGAEKYIDAYYSLEDMCLSAYKAEL